MLRFDYGEWSMKSIIKSLFLIFCFSFTTNAAVPDKFESKQPQLHLDALTWNEMEINENYRFNLPVLITDTFNIDQGEGVQFLDQIPLDGIRVQLFKFRLLNCQSQRQNQTSDMILILDRFGLQLDQGCILEVFLENQDLSYPGLFVSDNLGL